MKSPLRILHLEDDPRDAALVHAALEDQSIKCESILVQNRNDFVAELERGGIDLILSDFSLPTFDGLAAAQIVRQRWPAIPLILVSGTLGEDLCIDSFKNGATDYVLKERLSRLAPAVRRAMEESERRAEQKKLEANLIEAQKMDVLGQLAGGVAHDFNNILAVIMGYTDLTIRKLASNNEALSNLETIRSAAERAVGLTRQLLIFSRKQTVQPTVLNLNDVVSDLDKMLRRLIDENIEIKIIPGLHLGRINADSGYLGQVVMNLVVNARDAMPDGGVITIAASNEALDENFARAHAGVKPGSYVMLSVSDTGTGMTEEVKSHLFEAFFTTKPKGKGTGLGLTTCQTIVHQSCGHIVVDSKVSHGTTFRVYFPRVDQPLDVSAKASQNGPLPRGTETLLLVEDEPAVRNVTCRILETQGYRVLRASNGKEGLQVAREFHEHPISLVITDIIMPLMSGKVMAEWLKTANPELKILFTSGYNDEAIVNQGVFEKGVDFLAKPFSPATLSHKIRQMLDGPC